MTCPLLTIIYLYVGSAVIISRAKYNSGITFFISAFFMSSSSTSLRRFNTFGLSADCQQLIVAHTQKELVTACLQHVTDDVPPLILGGGSNLLLLEDYNGTVIKVETKGIKVAESERQYHLTVAAGESWHGLVEFCMAQHIAGLENLALIPGTVGAAPIQNIGAYGVEFAAVCDWVEYLNLDSGMIERLPRDECAFDYRNSIFKGALRGRAVVLQVGLVLSKAWQPNLSYGPLQALVGHATSEAVFETVCRIRSEKLPNPDLVGNVGSFFENPVISRALYERLQQRYPNIVGYPQTSGDIKLAAGWLIDSLGLKGFAVGDAAVHQQQALVLINRGNASSADVLGLAKAICQRVKAAFDVELVMEPRVYDARGERSKAL